MYYTENIGRYVKVHLDSEEVVEGWLSGGDYSRGIYVALPPDGKAIRFLPDEELSFIHYADDPPPPFPLHFDVKEYRELARAIEKRLADALGKVDLNRVKRIARSLTEDYWGLLSVTEYREIEREFYPSPYHLLELLLKVRNDHRELLDEVTDAGVTGVLREHREQIRRIVSRDTLPQVDGSLHIRRSALDSMIALTKETDALSETDDGKKYLDRLSADQMINFFSIVEAPPERESKGEDEPEPRDLRKARRLRKGAAWMKVAAGGALAAANVTTGALVGIVSALPSLGMGAVAAAVGVATSTYTGLNAASDGLKDLATAIEGKK